MMIYMFIEYSKILLVTDRENTEVYGPDNAFSAGNVCFDTEANLIFIYVNMHISYYWYIITFFQKCSIRFLESGSIVKFA